MKALRKTKSIDRPLLVIIIALLLTGLAVLASASFSLGERRFGNPYHFLYRQILYGVIPGIILFLIALRVPTARYRAHATTLLISSLILLAFVFIPGVGITIGGAHRWIGIGSFSFQPSEILKFTFIVYLAAWLVARKKEIGGLWSGFFPFLIVTFIGTIALVLEPDIGTLGVFALTALILFYLGGGRAAQISALIGLGILGLCILIYLEPYRKDRLFIFLNPGSESQGIGYQIYQALVAIGSGGFFGRGWGLSRQKFQYLPEPAGDAIFAIFAEELGFIGSFILLALFVAFFVRGMMIAARVRDFFARY
ncbi:MAG: FtsW/RodA/SpoVE family cell cycle protein, partial [Patescibacteria group bacterium]